MFWYNLGDKNPEKDRKVTVGMVWYLGHLAGILMPLWRSFMVWGGHELPSSRGLLWYRPYRRSTKLTFQRGQAGHLSELSERCGAYSEPESRSLCYGHHSAQLQARVLLWVQDLELLKTSICQKNPDFYVKSPDLKILYGSNETHLWASFWFLLLFPSTGLAPEPVVIQSDVAVATPPHTPWWQRIVKMKPSQAGKGAGALILVCHGPGVGWNGRGQSIWRETELCSFHTPYPVHVADSTVLWGATAKGCRSCMGLN